MTICVVLCFCRFVKMISQRLSDLAVVNSPAFKMSPSSNLSKKQKDGPSRCEKKSSAFSFLFFSP